MADAKQFFEQTGKDILAQAQDNTKSSEEEIERKMQMRELNKLRFAFYDQLKQHYSSRKYREVITIGCADKCLLQQKIGANASFREDTIAPLESQCLQSCFHKYYRYLAYSNTLYTYLINDEGKADEFVEFDD